jgi:PAS domain S-box-containing protein
VRTSLFDSSILATAQQAVEFVSNILESSTDYSIIGKDLDGKILLWNEGARRMYGYEAEEVVGKRNSEILHTPEDVSAGKPREIMGAALRDGKWEGVIGRIRKDGWRISARVVITPRRDSILRSYRLHADCYITKPVDLEGFLKVVKSIDSFWISVAKLPHEVMS